MNYGYYPQYGAQTAYPYMQPNMQNTAVPMQTTMQQPPIQNQQQSTMNTPIQNELMLVLVKDDNAVQNYPVANGNSVMLMNYDSGKFWIKSMTNGVTPTITEHKFEVVNGNQNPPVSNFVSQEEFKALSANVDRIQKIIEDLNS